MQGDTSPHTIAPGAGLTSGYGTLNLYGGLNTNAYTTLAFNLNLSTSIGTGSNGRAVYGGDLINMGSSKLNVSGGSITFTNNPTNFGDYRLFQGLGGSSSNVTAFSLPTAPTGDVYSLSSTADSGYLDLVVSAPFTPTSFSLWASLDKPRIMAGSTATLTGWITNSGGAGSDLLNYTLGASIASGTGSLGTLSNSSGTALAQGATSSPPSTAVFTGTAAGPVTLNLATTATNTNLGGPATGTPSIGVSLNALANRVVTAAPITLGNAQGRFMASQSVGGVARSRPAAGTTRIPA